MSERELLTTKQVLEKLQISRQTLWKLVNAGKIQQIKFGYKTARYNLADVEAYIQSHEKPATS